jgi:hypothetical protein
MQDTLAGFKRVAETAPDKSIVVWLNELLPGLRKRSFWPVVVARREIIGVGTILR